MQHLKKAYDSRWGARSFDELLSSGRPVTWDQQCTEGFRHRFKPESCLVDEISELKNEIEKLKTEMQSMKSCEKEIILNRMPIDEAEKKIEDYIKSKPGKNFDDFELMEKFKIPIDDVDIVLERMKKKGLISEKSQ